MLVSCPTAPHEQTWLHLPSRIAISHSTGHSGPLKTWGFIHSAKLSTPTLHFFTHITAIITRITEPHRRCSQSSPKTSPGFFQTPEPKARTSPRLTTAHLRRVLVRRKHPKGQHQTFLPEAFSSIFCAIFADFFLTLTGKTVRL